MGQQACDFGQQFLVFVFFRVYCAVEVMAGSKLEVNRYIDVLPKD